MSILMSFDIAYGRRHSAHPAFLFQGSWCKLCDSCTLAIGRHKRDAHQIWLVERDHNKHQLAQYHKSFVIRKRDPWKTTHPLAKLFIVWNRPTTSERPWQQQDTEYRLNMHSPNKISILAAQFKKKQKILPSVSSNFSSLVLLDITEQSCDGWI